MTQALRRVLRRSKDRVRLAGRQPFFVRDVELAVGEDERSAVGGGLQTLAAVDLLAALYVETPHDAAVVDDVEICSIGDRRRHVRAVVEPPQQIRRGDVAA